jgi:hypothetical protein
MTSGSYNTGGNPNVVYCPPGYRFSRTWSGVDGRTEPYAGGVRTKWNNYTGNIERRQTNQPDVRYQAKIGPTSNPWVTFTDPVNIGEYGPYASFEANDDLRLQSKLLEKVKGHSFNLAVNAAQLGLTVDLLASNLTKLGKSILALKRGDFTTAARQLGTSPQTNRRLKTMDVSGRWLELQYGWGPLLSDSYEACKAFHEISEGPRKSVFRTSIKRVNTKRQPQVTGVIEYSMRDFVARYLQYEMYEEMSVARQLGMLDPASVVWEVVPYSFVVDWFVPFGTYLDNLNAIPKLKGRFLTTNVTSRAGFDIRWSPAFNTQVSSGTRRAVFLPNVVWSKKSISRVFSNALTVEPPQFTGDGLSHGKRLWNAIALAAQAFGPAFKKVRHIDDG